MTLRNAEQALALLRSEGVLTLTPTPGRRSLVGEVVGGPVKGSWWGHEKGQLIFQLGEALGHSPEVLVAKLVAGKVTYVHRALWPALLRVVTDQVWRVRVGEGLSDSAKGLWAQVEKAGTVRLDPPSRDKRARAELEARGLVNTTSEHSDRGSHVAVLQAWKRWAPRGIPQEAAKLSLDEALRSLAVFGIFTSA